MEVKFIKDWNRIFIDTSIIISLFVAQKPNITDPNILFVKKLINYLSHSKSSNSKDRTFLVSTITVSELLTGENDTQKIQRIIKALDSENVEFVNFDLNSSLAFNALLYPHLSKKSLHQKAQDFGFATNDFMLAREWITRDFMIIISAKVNTCDLILTVDRNTFYPLTKDADTFCALAYPEYFDYSEEYILKYHHEKVNSESLNK